MHRLTLLLVMLVALPALAKSEKSDKQTDWRRVTHLHANTWIEVETQQGEVLTGSFVAASDTQLRLSSEVGAGVALLSARTLPRDQVKLIRQLPRPRDRARERKLLAWGAVGGAVGGVGIGAIYDAQHPYRDDPSLGKLAFGLLGTLAGMTTIATVDLLHRATQHKLIYRSPTVRGDAPPQSQSGSVKAKPAAG